MNKLFSIENSLTNNYGSKDFFAQKLLNNTRFSFKPFDEKYKTVLSKGRSDNEFHYAILEINNNDIFIKSTFNKNIIISFKIMLILSLTSIFLFTFFHIEEIKIKNDLKKFILIYPILTISFFITTRIILHLKNIILMKELIKINNE